ncbi:unnamed protein product [Bursaphelenchus okinawaensis]|uniref:Integrase catalytic domain-containing protein n=1 Tax=Bursaphelenchus okinawaensis TaxID=465554 RepID=A0A811JS12_9BILA|nr:unnamed protein product [Bursaphelenchus okinawaensis]CAG9080939.1 unnamed protein product [Bursaphelenchus okinawaensis]
MGNYWLVLVDSYTKWCEIHPMTKITSKALITKLRQLFATFGIPEQVVSDNGRQFTSTEFKNFCLSNGIQHLFSPPDKQSCNGQAERFVGSFKMAMNKAVGESGSALDKANRWLFQYRLTPHPATGMAPANLMFGRQIRSRLDLLPRTPRKVPREEQIQVQKYTATALKNANKATKPRQFNVDDFVYARMYNSGTVKWIEGRIDSFDGTKIALVVTDSGIIRRHVDQLKHRHGPSGDADSSPQIPMFIPQNNGGGGNNEVPDIPEGSDSLPGSVNGDVLNGGGAAENNTRELNPEAGNLSGYSARRSSLGRLLEGTSAGRIKRHVAPPVRLSYDKDA